MYELKIEAQHLLEAIKEHAEKIDEQDAIASSVIKALTDRVSAIIDDLQEPSDEIGF